MVCTLHMDWRKREKVMINIYYNQLLLWNLFCPAFGNLSFTNLISITHQFSPLRSLPSSCLTPRDCHRRSLWRLWFLWKFPSLWGSDGLTDWLAVFMVLGRGMRSWSSFVFAETKGRKTGCVDSSLCSRNLTLGFGWEKFAVFKEGRISRNDSFLAG